MGAGRPREPIDLLIAKGKKHLTKAEIEERRAQEIDVPFTDIQPPSFLPKPFHKEFYEISDKLKAIGIMTELDTVSLAQYLIAKQNYISYTAMLLKVIKRNSDPNRQVLDEDDVIENTKIQALQDRALRQCQTCARDLGLTITSRAKIAIPQPPDDDDEL
jgi:P27 family predicted phage terminase small subunit